MSETTVRGGGVTAPRPFALLDRDGTLIVEKHYLSDPEGVELLPGVVEGLRLLRAAGCGLALVTNQSGIGRGYYTEADMHAVNRRLRDILAREDVLLDAAYFCPHAPGVDCRCRKPLPGMAEDAIRDFGFDPKHAFVIGDKACDVDLGRAIGASSILVLTGHGHDARSRPDFTAPSFLQAAEWVAAKVKKRKG